MLRIRSVEDFFMPMGKYPLLFQAEIMAILECWQENLWLGCNDKSINIFSHSQAAIRALKLPGVQLKLSLVFYEAISILGKWN